MLRRKCLKCWTNTNNRGGLELRSSDSMVMLISPSCSTRFPDTDKDFSKRTPENFPLFRNKFQKLSSLTSCMQKYTSTILNEFTSWQVSENMCICVWVRQKNIVANNTLMMINTWISASIVPVHDGPWQAWTSNFVVCKWPWRCSVYTGQWSGRSSNYFQNWIHVENQHENF